MSNRFKLLDLFCGGGGAAMGYARAGFQVTGVDVKPQPNYPFPFLQMDALSMDYEALLSYDVIHASPPCHVYSRASALARKWGKVYPDLYHQTKAMLVASGKPFIIENVQGSPIRGGLCLCGTMFGLGVFRHRLFESNVRLQKTKQRCSCKNERIGAGYVSVAGNLTNKRAASQAMGIDWITNKRQLFEAIPPAYTQFIGLQLMKLLNTGIHEKLALVTPKVGIQHSLWELE
ncbi:MAG: DNA cytosine methyltransferase [Anaerolineales bacterium]|nr:DNA cytosine methyltransferase [Anaerolineales bacterium]